MRTVLAKPLRHVFTVTSGATPESGNSEYWDGDILWVTPEDVSSLGTYWLGDTRRKVTQAGYESCNTTIAPSGSIVLTKRAPIGQVAVLTEPACCNQGCFLLIPRREEDTRFFYYWLSVQTEHLQALGRGSTFMELSTDELKSLRIPHLPLAQQRAIADYLDRETARIDALIAAKERLLGLLAEKRRALITRAVTRGLDPTVPLRDSGIPWLGEIPAHWEVVPLKYGFGRIGSGTTPPTGTPEYYDGDVAWVTTSELRENEILATNQYLSRSALSDFSALRIYPVGSVLFAMYGATIGRVAILGIEATVNQAVCVLADPGRLQAKFAFYVLQSSRDHLVVQASGGGQPNLTAEKVRDHRVPCPPMAEQCAIADYLDGETAKLNAVRAATERTIALLKERRAALIAAAVTGQIDVEATA